MRFGLLGTLEVVGDDDAPIEVGGGQARTVLAMLLAAEGRLVPAEALLDALWGDDPPASANGTLQSYVSRLRRALEPGRAAGAPAEVLRWEPPGYRVTVPADQVDFRRFERLAAEGRRLADAGDLAAARDALVEADALWRGPALLEFADHDFAAGLAGRLEERRLAAIDDRVAADLALGRHTAVAAELGELVAANPLREALWGHYALALYRSGRQSDALRALDRARRTLRDELGVEPGRPLRDLESRILDQDPSLDPVAPAPAPAPADPTSTAAVDASPPVVDDDDPGRPGIVGRRGELDQLTVLLDHLATGPRMVIVEGEPGIGKTTLAEAVADEARRRGALVVWGRCNEGDAAPALWPWLAALRALATGRPGLVDTAPTAFGWLLDPDPIAGQQPGPPGPGRFQLFEAIADAFSRAAADAPVVVVLDDLQWADEGSLELLTYLAGRLDAEPVLVLSTVRELEVGRNDSVVEALAAVTRRPGSRRFRLRGLAAAETGELLSRATGQVVPGEVAAAIHDRAEGNPFYATELARLLVDDAGRYDAGALTAAEVPAGVRDVVRRRLSRLPAATVEVLQVGAVIGRDPELGLLTRAAAHSVEEVLDCLEPALVQRLLVAEADQAATFRFTHALVREVLVEDVSPLRRARIHLRVADAIVPEGEAVPDDQAEIVAEHLWAAAPLGVGDRAASALERAAEVAVRRTAYAAAEDMLERALQIRRAAGPGIEAAEAELDVVSRLAAVQRARHGYAHASALFERGRDLAERLGRTEAYLELLWAEWAGADTACDFARARPIAAQFRELSTAGDDPRFRMIGLGVWGIQCWHDGRMTEAGVSLDAAAELARTVEVPTSLLAFASEHRLLSSAFRVHVHDLIGDVDDTETLFRDLVREQGDRFSTALVWCFGSAGALARGDYERTGRCATLGLEADPDVAFTFWGSGLQMYQGLARMHLGEVDEGERQFLAGRRTYLDAGVRTAMGSYLANYTMALVRAGRLEDARRWAGEARIEFETHGERWPEPLVLCAEAELAHALGAEVREVAALLGSAAAVATTQGSLALAERARLLAERLGVTVPT